MCFFFAMTALKPHTVITKAVHALLADAPTTAGAPIENVLRRVAVFAMSAREDYRVLVVVVDRLVPLA